MSLFDEFFGQEELSEGNASSEWVPSDVNGSAEDIQELSEVKAQPAALVQSNNIVQFKQDTQQPESQASEDPVYRDLFGEPIQTANSSRKSGTAPSKTSRSSSAAHASSALKRSIHREWQDQDIEVGLDFTIHYATKTFLVSEVLEEIPESGCVHLNRIREALFKLYWDFSEERTKWDYNLEEKKLRPIITGEKNN
ncbi:hypothetical protein [Paenibacillus tepidiphilus]|uniref:hypothetical protein n=1 Tax=Paenibacillus tepidiphilus TaxID=2608683 RepID=UPI00123AA4AE|nr:hypothetical protein [Paenibacillus tepidiphilus]